MQAKLNRTTVSHYWCYKQSDWYNIWLNLGVDLFAKTCFVDNFKMIFDDEFNQMINTPGVQIRVEETISTETVEYLDPTFYSLTNYMSTLVFFLVSKMGYTKGETLQAFVYDFRVAPLGKHKEEFFKKLTSHIKQMSEKYDSKVLILSHSLGSVMFSHFLSSANSHFRSKYVDSWYSISGAFGGSFEALRSLILGNPFGIPDILSDDILFRSLAQSFPSVYFLLPSPDIFGKDMVVLKTSSKEYSINDILHVLMKELNLSQANYILKNVPPVFIKNIPDIPIACVFSTGYNTVYFINFTGELNESKHSFFYTDGDGTVSYESLVACSQWKEKKKQMEVIELEKLDHMGILRSNKLFNHLSSFIKKRSEPKSISFLFNWIITSKNTLQEKLSKYIYP